MPSQRKCSASWYPSKRMKGFGKTGRLQHKRCRARYPRHRRSTAHLRDYCLYTPRAMLTRQPEGLAGEVNRLRYSFRCNPSLGETGQAGYVESTSVITILLDAASDLYKYRKLTCDADPIRKHQLTKHCDQQALTLQVTCRVFRQRLGIQLRTHCNRINPLPKANRSARLASLARLSETPTAVTLNLYDAMVTT